MNEQTKPWYRSKGFLGPLLAAVLYALRSLGIIHIDDDQMLQVAYKCVEFAGIVLGVAGRALARTRLTLGSEGAGRP